MRDAIQRLIGERAAAFRDLEAALDLQDCEWRTPPCGVLLTDTLPLADARALFLAIAGGDPAALTPVLIGEEGLRPDYFAMARISELDAALERHTASATASPDDPFRAQAEEIERTRAHLTGLCDRIAAQLGRPIDDVLGRLDVDALAAFEDGDDEELEPDEDPEVDPAAVYARALAERRAFVEHAKKAYPGTPVRVGLMRTNRPHSAHRSGILRSRAATMRVAPTTTEALRGSRLGVAFRRQVVLGEFIADFIAPSVRLVVEVDGACHAHRARADAGQDRAPAR